jgi:selT/selW/selH-like putative selenoprotein
LAADLENKFGESSELIQSSGGVFEIEANGQLLYSKKALNRFPEEGEVEKIYQLVESGKPLAEAQEEAGQGAKKPPSFVEWFTAKFLRA